MHNKFSLIHLTDIHLNFCTEKCIKNLSAQILLKKPNAIVITGDIAEAPTILDYLANFSILLNKTCPIFFVLGNHDYYNGSITEVRSVLERLFTYSDEHKANKLPRLAWLTTSGVVPLTKDVAIVGDDGWYDGQYADWFSSKIMLNDYLVIDELSDYTCATRQHKFDKINELSKNSAANVKNNIEKAFETFSNVFVATHVPPFRESSTYKGRISDKDWMPHFSSKAMGDVLYNLAVANPKKNITVLCGHTHGFADVKITSNLRAITGSAEYRKPTIGKIFTL